MTLSAFTPASGYVYYPPFFNARIDGGEVVLTVRAPEEDGVCGDMASMRVPVDEWRRILAELVAETERQAPTPEGREERS